MRIISQNKRVDVNYDLVSLILEKTNGDGDIVDLIAKDQSGNKYFMGEFPSLQIAHNILLDVSNSSWAHQHVYRLASFAEALRRWGPTDEKT